MFGTGLRRDSEPVLVQVAIDAMRLTSLNRVFGGALGALGVVVTILLLLFVYPPRTIS